jgi:hypothetical protein
MKTKKMLPSATKSRHIHGFLMMDLIVGMAILTLAIAPLAFTFVHERHLLHAEYLRAVVVEIVDGEMEILAAGEWQAIPEGSQVYTVHARAAAGLPPGHFQLTRTGRHLRLEWKSDEPRGIGLVVREITVK